MVNGWLICGRLDASEIGPVTANVMISGSGVPFAVVMAVRSVPGPLSARDVTVIPARGLTCASVELVLRPDSIVLDAETCGDERGVRARMVNSAAKRTTKRIG